MPRNSAYAAAPANKSTKRKQELPSEAKGNPVYDQTWEDRALCCFGEDCPRNSRIAAIFLILIGIGASIWTNQAVTFFSFEAFRNDTFFDLDKQQPEPFQYATEADVGLFHYRLIAVYEYKDEDISTSSQTDSNNVFNNRYLDEKDANVMLDQINKRIRAESNLGQSQEYALGRDQFPEDGTFSAAQTASIWAPILAAVGLIFALFELCLKKYRCSSLPTSICLCLAFAMQITTLFIFSSEEFCNYAQDCTMGIGGYLSILAILCYILAQTITCCGPRPEPLYGFLLESSGPRRKTQETGRKKTRREPTR